MSDDHMVAALQLAARVERLIAETLKRSAPLSHPHAKAPEITKPGVRRVVPGPRACRRWGGR